MIYWNYKRQIKQMALDLSTPNGQISSIIVTNDGTVIDGHLRAMAGNLIGMRIHARTQDNKEYTGSLTIPSFEGNLMYPSGRIHRLGVNCTTSEVSHYETTDEEKNCAIDWPSLKADILETIKTK